MQQQPDITQVWKSKKAILRIAAPILRDSLQNSTMTYPLSKLPYSSQRRLHELARPVELYRLQLADVDNTLYLNPIQHIAERHFWVSYSKDGLFHYNGIENKTKINLGPTTLMKIGGIGVYEIVDSPYFHHPELQYLIFDLPGIDIKYCVVTTAFMVSLKTWMPNLIALNFVYSTINAGITIGALIAAYPDTKYINLQNCVYPEQFFADLKDVLKMQHSDRAIKVFAENYDWLTKDIAADIIEVLRGYDNNSLFTFHIDLTKESESVLFEMFWPLFEELYGPEVVMTRASWCSTFEMSSKKTCKLWV